ncbi:adenosylcobalamin-dependent ribonucleoside-diphosphate reductase [Thiocapsa bogorovii]|uniref:adenosylcobalamin-dependent ribonucleoside-diphosphate reductase n=1 Tax=Thiocapsa bogorovii TaxID=521689 RepID=UPI001E472D95|nr:adenosylcobalamin-dependent ribonucleoside-diphosphate reductase [Thiocapsa bogorovii]UHD17361.1 adenosylcobalamin-dependent ribonucleoside-diphosphate reductase [Thiocapsa bogorovii]
MNDRQPTISRLVWESRYRAEGENDLDATRQRVARALASAEPVDREIWAARYLDLLTGFRFLPGGRILAGAGVDRDLTLFNCFVMGPIPDDLAGIFDALRDAALTMQQGGGVGCDFSTLRPAGLRAERVGGTASGPVSFMGLWDSMCATLLSTGVRRGAMMGTLRCDHPDIEVFIDVKRDADALRNFNLSVLVTDDLMQALAADAPWELVFPVEKMAQRDRARFPGRLMRVWPGCDAPVACAVLRILPARALWARLMRANYDAAEPGVLFIDRINAENNLAYRERICATNPCGEIPLPSWGACDLGALNMTAFVREPFDENASLDLDALADAAGVATRMLDAVIDLSRFPLPEQAEQARGSRRIGLGITGLADALVMLGLRYDSPAGRDRAAAAMRTVCHAAYRTSVALALEKGPFPYLVRDAYLASPFVRRLPEDIRAGIASIGIRNSHLTAIAPTGTISLLANDLSSGIEPVFARVQHRRVRTGDGTSERHRVEDHAVQLWRERFGRRPGPPAFVAAREVAPEEHLAMQAAVQHYVDNAISKTINVPTQIPFASFERLYRRAYDLGLKGCTTFRPNPVTGEILSDDLEARTPEASGPCCPSERDGD